MAQLTMTVYRNDGSSSSVTPIIAGDTTGRVNTSPVVGKVNPADGTSSDVTPVLPGYTPVPGSE